MTDHTLKKFFDDTKRQDASNTPSFHRVLRKQAATNKDSSIFRWMPFALAAALLVAAALLAFSILPKNDTHTVAEVEQWAVISDWTPSSDAVFAENAPGIGVSLSTSSDLLFEFAPFSSSLSKNQKL